MRHGSRPWTPAEIIADFERHGADDQDSSYDKEDRAVPEVSPEEFLRDPEATWRKFRREAERPGHISSHRSAYRRLPQYLKPLEVEKHMAMRRYLEREEEQQEEEYRQQLLEYQNAYRTSLDAWLAAIGASGEAPPSANYL